MNRRKLIIGGILMSAFGIIGFGKNIINFLQTGSFSSRENPPEKILLGKRQNIISPKPRMFGHDNGRVIVFLNSRNQQKLFLMTCTHNGCQLKFKHDEKITFHCPCHGSIFNEDGRIIAAPATVPLVEYKIDFTGENAYAVRM